MPHRHTPSRLCVGCGKRSPKEEMIRFTVDKEGTLKVSPWSEGRGAYLHRDPNCWQQFAARKGTVRSLGRGVERNLREALVHTLAAMAKEI
ncbi:MAG: YlxR family protein [Candidatus Binatia bacterium]|nr:YlxR family protein [Candidatus Binatia bacterium]